MKFDKKFLPVIIFVVLIIFSVGWYQFFYESTRREILNIELEARRLQEIKREILDLKARHKNLATFIEQKELEIDAAKNFLPSTLMQDKFMGELYRAADVNRVRLTSVQAGEIISEEKIQAQAVNVHLEADYVSLLNFIREMLDGERLARLEKFLVTNAGNGIISCELTFKIFAEPIKESVANISK